MNKQDHYCSLENANIFGANGLLPGGTVGVLVREELLLEYAWEPDPVLVSLKKGTRVRILSVLGLYKNNRVAAMVEVIKNA